MTGDPVGIGNGTLVLEPHPSESERPFDIAEGAESDLVEVVMGHEGSCAEGAGFAGYGSPVDGGFADDPCTAVI